MKKQPVIQTQILQKALGDIKLMSKEEFDALVEKAIKETEEKYGKMLDDLAKK